MIAYKIDNIQAKTGKVRIVVIANSTHYNELAALKTTTYENLKGLSETVSGGTFDASNLVKVGELPSYELNTTVTSIRVPMTQLAARIDMKFTVDEEPETISGTSNTKVTNQWFYSVTKLTVNNINQNQICFCLIEITDMIMLSLQVKWLPCKTGLHYLSIPMRS